MTIRIERSVVKSGINFLVKRKSSYRNTQYGYIYTSKANEQFTDFKLLLVLSLLLLLSIYFLLELK